MIAPQAPQYNSTRLLSFCIDHSPQAGQGGRPFSLGATLGPIRRFFLRGIYHPPLGFLTFGILSDILDIRGCLKTLLHHYCEVIVQLRMDMDCVVIGAGVSGLSSAIRLLESGHSVRVMAREFSPDLVSDVAAALWYPFLAHPMEKTDRWGAETYTELMRLGEEEPMSGITMKFGREYLREVVELPGWRNNITHFRVLDSGEIPEGWIFGWEFESPIIEMHHYMPWLLQRTRDLGGLIEECVVEDLAGITAEVIVNCSGIGARELCQDTEVKPVRGQIIYIDQDPGFGRFDQQPETLTYTIARRDCTVLGGTAQSDDWSLELRDSDRETILQKCEAVWPELDRSKIIGESVGLRPSRSEVRLESEIVNGTLVIHNYGHGGAGVTLSWGCADEVVSLIEES